MIAFLLVNIRRWSRQWLWALMFFGLTVTAGAAATAPPVTINVARFERGRILKDADAALHQAPITITKYHAKLSPGGPHEYYSNGDYWWPNPNTSNGLPYVRRDGLSNPNNFNEDRECIRRLRDAVTALGAAYKITGKDRYVKKAVELLRVFFLDPKTRMNPNLRYAQAVPGVAEGRSYGIIDTLHLIGVPKAIEAMDRSPAFPPVVLDGLKEWFAEYAHWMRTSKNGLKEANAKNNHSVAYWLQIAVFARFIGDSHLLDECRQRFKEDFVPKQMAANGSFPRELARTKPYGYSIFQLDNMATLCQVLSTPKDDLWTFTLPDGRGMRKAMEFLYPYLADKSKWPYRHDVQVWNSWPAQEPSLLFAGLAYHDQKYIDLWKRLRMPTNQEVRRNMAIRQPILWLNDSGHASDDLGSRTSSAPRIQGPDALGVGRKHPFLSHSADPSYTMSAQSLGVNTTSFDRAFADEGVAGLLRRAGIGRVRLGGSGADVFNWASKTVPLTWPRFMSTLARAKAAPVITVNYGLLKVGGIPGTQAAANWMSNALALPNYSDSTALWIIGNEEYGAWEPDQHQNPHVPQAYAANALRYLEAIHAVDPNAKVGVPITISRSISPGTGTWVPDANLWNTTVLSEGSKQIDFIDFHWYPVFGAPVMSNAQIFQTVRRIPVAMKYLDQLVDRYDPGIFVSVSESNISEAEIVYNAQPVAALYAAATALTFLSHGASDYMWWQVHNSDNMDGDFGFLSNGTGRPGPSLSRLAAPAAIHARNITVASAAGFHYGHQFTIGSGENVESRKITALPGSTQLSAASAASSSNIYVKTTGPYTMVGSDTNYQELFAPGARIVIGTGADAQSDTVVSVGTGSARDSLVAPSPKRSSTIYLTGVATDGQKTPIFVPTGIVAGARLTIGSGSTAETATVKAVGESSSLGTTLVAPAKRGATRIYVASVTNTRTGVANYVGDPIVIGSGSGQEVDKIASVGTSAGAPTTLVRAAASGATELRIANAGYGFSGSSFWPGNKAIIGTGASREIDTISSVGAQAAPTTLSAAIIPGSSTIHVASVKGFAPGDDVAVGFGFGRGRSRQIDTVSQVGTAGATGTGVTLTAPLKQAHGSGTVVQDLGAVIHLSSGLMHAQDAGAPAQDIGTGIALAAPLSKSHAIGTRTIDAGTGIVLAAPLRYAHLSGETVSTPGTGIRLATPLRAGHASGETVTSEGITLTPALSRAFPVGAPIKELGLKEPPLDTPMPAFWGFLLASKLTTPESRLSVLPSPEPAIIAFQSFLANRSETVMLINTDDTAPATISLAGLPGGSGAALRTYSYSLEEPVLDPAVVPGSAKVGTARSGLVLAPESILVISGRATGDIPPRLSLHSIQPIAVSGKVRIEHVPKSGVMDVTVRVSPEIHGAPECTLAPSERVALSPGRNHGMWTATIGRKSKLPITCKAMDSYGNVYRAFLRGRRLGSFPVNRETAQSFGK